MNRLELQEISREKPRAEEDLACPARFERATYALEAVKMSLNNTKNNDLSLARSGVALAPRIVGLSGRDWFRYGIGRCSVG